MLQDLITVCKPGVGNHWHKKQASVSAGVWTICSIESVGTGWLCLSIRVCVFIDNSFLLLFIVLPVVGVAKHIDWYGPSGDRIEPNRPDITVTRNDESSSTLTLYKAGTENAGTYKCVATAGDQQAESTVKVKIFRKYFSHLTHSKLLSGMNRKEKKSCLLNS